MRKEVAKWFWRAKLYVGRGFQWLERRGLRVVRPSTAACVPFTYLFRDVRDYRQLVIDYYAQKQTKLRFLSLGCATGQEPFSIALVCAEAGIPCEVVGIDLFPQAIAVAQKGVLNLERERATAEADLAEDPLSGADEALRLIEAATKYFHPIAPGSSEVTLADEIRSRVSFHQMDICDIDYADQFDFIVCRKMLHYLPAGNRKIAGARMRAALKRDAPLSNVIFDGYTKKQPFFSTILDESR